MSEYNSYDEMNLFVKLTDKNLNTSEIRLCPCLL